MACLPIDTKTTLALSVQVDWKLTRGKFRPRLLDYAKEHSDAVVQSASTEAFRLAQSSNGDDGKAAIAQLAKLKARSTSSGRLSLGPAAVLFNRQRCQLGVRLRVLMQSELNVDLQHRRGRRCYTGHRSSYSFRGAGCPLPRIAIHE